MTYTDGSCVLPHMERPHEARGAVEGTLVCVGHSKALLGLLVDLSRYPSDVVTVTCDETVAVSIAGTYTSGTKERPMPVSDARADHILHIRTMLGEWVRLVAEERHVAVPDYADPVTTGRFLTTHHMWIIEQPWIDDYHRELRELAGTARVLLYPPKGNNRTQLPCPLTDTEGCTGTLRSVSAKGDGEEEGVFTDVVSCDSCGFVLTADQFRTYRRQLAKKVGTEDSDQVLVTEEDALLWALAEGLRITGPTIRQWASRGHIGRHERSGRVLYDLDELKARVDMRKAA